MSAISGFCEKCNKFRNRKRHCDGNRNTCMSILFDTIEALQAENEQLKADLRGKDNEINDLKADLERRTNMIRVSRVDVNWLEAETFENPTEVIYGGLVVHYFNGGVEGQATLDIPENIAMNLTLSDIRKNVVLKLRETQ